MVLCNPILNSRHFPLFCTHYWQPQIILICHRCGYCLSLDYADYTDFFGFSTDPVYLYNLHKVLIYSSFL